MKFSILFTILFFLQSSSDSGGVVTCCVIPGGIVLIVFLLVYGISSRNKAEVARIEKEKLEGMSDEEKKEYYERKKREEKVKKHGYTNPKMICPHCNTKGKVRTKEITQKKGISGSKATGAVLTGGASVLATGLSRKENATQAHCDNCGNDWIF